jgi:hypothetical protein
VCVGGWGPSSALLLPTDVVDFARLTKCFPCAVLTKPASVSGIAAPNQTHPQSTVVFDRRGEAALSPLGLLLGRHAADPEKLAPHSSRPSAPTHDEEGRSSSHVHVAGRDDPGA